MNEVPKDIMSAAGSVLDSHRLADGSALKRSDEMIRLIARALFAEREAATAKERERCARIADAFVAAASDQMICDDDRSLGARVAATHIAAAIRKGEDHDRP